VGDKRVGLDTRALSNINRQRGIGRYSTSLINALIDAGRGFDFVLFGYGSEHPADITHDNRERAEWVSLPRSPRLSYLSLFADHALMARAVSRSRLELFHAIDHNMTPFLTCPTIVTVHDLIPLVLRGPYLGPRSSLWLAFHKMAVKRAKAVIAVSRNTANDVERLWKIPADRLRVIPEGVGDVYRPMEDGAKMERVMQKFGIRRPYFLYLGGFDPRKNLGNMLLAFKRFLLSDSGDYSFVLCGDTTDFDAYLHDEIAELGLQGKVLLTGFVEEENLPALYSGAEGFICVSLYEGFGLPFLEAMACGTPVIASDTSSIPEVVGDSGILVDPLDPADILKGMERVAASSELRDELSRRGQERAASFSWETAASRVLNLYYDVLEGGGAD
jgi:glycosyltransferase involved in cell wall biosynthesis